MGSSDQKREMPSLTSSGPSTWYPTASSGHTPGKLSASRGSEALPKKRCLELSGARTPAFIEAAEFQTRSRHLFLGQRRSSRAGVRNEPRCASRPAYSLSSPIWSPSAERAQALQEFLDFSRFSRHHFPAARK